MKEGSSTEGGLGVSGSDEAFAEESIVAVPDEGGKTIGSVASGVSIGHSGRVSDSGSPAASVVCARRVVEDPLRGPVVVGAAAGVL